MYTETVRQDTKRLWNLLSPDFPDWLNEYIDTPAMLRLHGISMVSGDNYTHLFDNVIHYPQDSLDHSIGVALIVWHFTRNKKQTLAGLFHDISTGTFKHTLDFLNGDYMTQESTEELTTEIINNSDELMALLARDNIDVGEVDDYHMYSIADNDTPQLSADRLEYSLDNMTRRYHFADFKTIQKFYNDLSIQTDENGNDEIGFSDIKLAREFVRLTTLCSLDYRSNETIFSMQVLSDILNKALKNGDVKQEDFYTLTEKDIIKKLEHSSVSESVKKWRQLEKIERSKEHPPINTYYVHHSAKLRWIDPLVNNKRVSKIDSKSKAFIDKNFNTDFDFYVYADGILESDLI
ncbi:MAG: hypothetical protein Q4E47_00130 [Candidatus Saccharibacteria bacterium]|nr:hypothetical protein [Candidatus Saccharibacteria bacterium]